MCYLQSIRNYVIVVCSIIVKTKWLHGLAIQVFGYQLHNKLNEVLEAK